MNQKRLKKLHDTVMFLAANLALVADEIEDLQKEGEKPQYHEAVRGLVNSLKGKNYVEQGKN